jgi:ABC-type branched-subunit amino acid transport system substrate-binding protein
MRGVLKSALLALGLLSACGTAAWAAEPGVTDTEIRIGDVNIMTGPASFIGQAVSVGSKVAAAEINAAGGINGRKLVILTEDDGYVPARSFQALKKLIEVDGIFALNGTSGTANVLAMMPLITKANLPTVVTTAPNELVYNPVRPSVFTIGASYETAFFAQLKYIHEHNEPKNPVYGLIRQDDDFGVAVEAGYSRAIKELGLKDGIRLKYKKGQTDFGAELLQMREAGVNVLANGAIIASAANVLSEARKLGLELQVADVWSEIMPPSAKLLAPAGYSFFVGDYIASMTDPAAIGFLDRTKQYMSDTDRQAVNRYTFITYAGLKVMAKAMAACGKELTRACTVENLKKIHGFETDGLTAPVSFDNAKQLGGTEVKVYQVNLADVSFKTLTAYTQY